MAYLGLVALGTVTGMVALTVVMSRPISWTMRGGGRLRHAATAWVRLRFDPVRRGLGRGSAVARVSGRPRRPGQLGLSSLIRMLMLHSVHRTFAFTLEVSLRLELGDHVVVHIVERSDGRSSELVPFVELGEL
jgi:hypothetical protein